jgi:hypothetical protein
MRWFYLPNEGVEGGQIGPRKAFETLLADGELSAYEAYSYLVQDKLAATHADALAKMLNAIREFRPDVIFIQRTTDAYPMQREYLRQLKAVPGNPKLVLYEEDPYGRFVKRIDATMHNVMAECDMAVLSGNGYLLDLAYRAGARKIRFAPHSYDSIRFDTPWVPTRSRKWDAVMIANLTCLKRIPFLFMPGGRSRKLAARRLHRHLGDRFALFGGGQGWSGETYCRGRIAYDQQGDAIRDSWMSINWGQFDQIGMYSSDRLPISLACGVPHITNYQPGYEHIYQNIPGLFIIRTPAEATDVALYLLSKPIDERIDLGIRAAAFARSKLHATKVYGDIVRMIREQLIAET